MNRPLLEVKNLTKTYRQGQSTIPVLRGVSFALQAGEILALRGVSGSGKSTLLHLIGLLDTFEQGEILLQGASLTGLSDVHRTLKRRASIGFLYQQSHLLEEFTALENVMVPYLLLGLSLEEASRNASQLLARMNLDKRASHKPTQLSGGERHRVALARALAPTTVRGSEKTAKGEDLPFLLIADEPTGNLDQKTAHEIIDLLIDQLKKLSAGALIATHDPLIAQRMDRTLTLSGGVIS